ncbi:hypothetical protein Taro_043108, partial [Colocasia esculenta]|nr:hypothetical protein [Colocasia esculenta]
MPQDVIHTNCLVSHIQSFPPQTAPAGYVCPACSSPGCIRMEKSIGPIQIGSGRFWPGIGRNRPWPIRSRIGRSRSRSADSSFH